MKNFVVVGGSHGIGEAISEKLLAEGHQVFTFSRTQGLGQWQEWSMGDDLNSLKLPERIDGFVYAPGTITLKPFHQLKKEDFEEDWRVNFLGATQWLGACYLKLKLSPEASVVLFSTVAAQRGMAFHASIAAAKGAVEGLVKSLAQEWAPHIRVNAIAPSLVETPLSKKIWGNEKLKETTAQKHPLKRIGQAEDIAAMAQFLLSPQSSWMTGQILHVDGGMSL